VAHEAILALALALLGHLDRLLPELVVPLDAADGELGEVDVAELVA